jgi:hypothetical protein
MDKIEKSCKTLGPYLEKAAAMIKRHRFYRQTTLEEFNKDG